MTMSITNPAEQKGSTSSPTEASSQTAPSAPTQGAQNADTIRQAIEAAEARAAANDRKGAIAELERALSVDPNVPFVLKTLGGLLMQEESHFEALQRYRQLIRIQPDNAEVHVLSAVAALGMGRLDEFNSGIARALELDPVQSDALRWRARVAFDNLDHAAAGRDYARLVGMGHSDVDTLTALGFCLARGGQWEMAAETFAGALVAHGTAEVARENLGVARGKIGRGPLPTGPDDLAREASEDLAKGNMALACWAWIELLKIRPRDHETRRLLVGVMLERKWMVAALPHLEELVRFNPWDPDLGTWLALVRFEAGQKAKAWEGLQSVFTLDPRHLEARRLEVDLTLREGRHEEAWWLVKRLCQDHPEDVVSRLSRGICAFHCHRWDEAVEDLEWVLGRQPDNDLVRRNRDMARERAREALQAREEARLRATVDEAGRLQNAGDLKAAIALLVPVTEQRPDWAEAWDALGSLRYMVGDVEGGRRDLLQASRLSPGLPDLQVRLAMACDAGGRRAEAVALLDQVTEEQPLHGAGHRLRGDLLLESEPDAARDSYSACLRATPALAEDLLRLGIALVQSGRHDQARAVFDAVLAFQPDHPAALKARARFGSTLHD